MTNGEASSIVTLMLVGTVVNGSYAVSKKQDPFPTILTGVILLGLVLLIAEATGNSDVAVLLGGTFLISSILLHGQWFFTFLTNLSGTSGVKA